MKRFIRRSRRRLQRFWRTEYKVFGKKWYLGSFIAAFLILVVVVFSVSHFGLIGFLVFWAKQGVRVLLLYAAKLTLQSLLLTGIKRAFIDGAVTPMLKNHVYPYLIPAIIARLKHVGRRVGKILAVVFGGTIVIGSAVGMFLYQGIAFLWAIGGFLSTKLATILGFKTLWIFAGQAWIWVKTTSIGTFVQVYLLSWVFDFLGRLIPRRFKRRLRPLWSWIFDLFDNFQNFLERVFGIHLEKRIRAIARWIEPTWYYPPYKPFRPKPPKFQPKPPRFQPRPARFQPKPPRFKPGCEKKYKKKRPKESPTSTDRHIRFWL